MFAPFDSQGLRENIIIFFTSEENENRELKPLCGYIVDEVVQGLRLMGASRRNRKKNEERQLCSYRSRP